MNVLEALEEAVAYLGRTPAAAIVNREILDRLKAVLYDQSTTNERTANR